MAEFARRRGAAIARRPAAKIAGTAISGRLGKCRAKVNSDQAPIPDATPKAKKRRALARYCRGVGVTKVFELASLPKIWERGWSECLRRQMMSAEIMASNFRNAAALIAA
jgi:hypothetical protein